LVKTILAVSFNRPTDSDWFLATLERPNYGENYYISQRYICISLFFSISLFW